MSLAVFCMEKFKTSESRITLKQSVRKKRFFYHNNDN